MRIAATLLAVLLPAGLFSQGSSSGLSHHGIPGLPRPAAMGQALVADPGVLSSAVTNPANLLNPGLTEIMLSHSEWIQDVRSEFLTARIPISDFSVGLSVRSTNIEGIEIRERPGPAIGTVTARSLSIGATGAVEAVERATIGLTLRYLYEKMYVDESNGYSLDLGILYRTPLDGLTAGFSLTNLGRLGAFREQAVTLPAMLNLGARYGLAFDEFALVLAPAFLLRLDPSTPMAAIGAEVSYQHMVSLRVGYQSGYDARALSAGLGVRYELVGVDYAYVPFSEELGSSHIISVGVSF